MTDSTYKPKALFWEKNFIENFRDNNANLNIGIIIWNKDPSIIKSQIRKAMQDKADVLLSEILPDDLQDNLLDEEYDFFCQKYLYVPPNIEKSKQGKSKGDSILIILNNTDERNQDSFWRICLPLIEKLENTKVVYADDDVVLHKEITANLREFAKIYIDCDNPQMSIFYVLNSLTSNIPIFIETPETVSTRLWALGVTGFETKNNPSKNISLRTRFKNLTDLNFLTPLNSTIFSTFNLDFSEIKNFEKFHENSRIKDFLYQTRNNTDYLENVTSALIPSTNKTQKSNVEVSRFKINFLRNLLHNSQIEPNVQKEVFQKLFLHLLRQDHTKYTFERLYYLFKNNPACLGLVTETLKLNRALMSEHRRITEQNFFYSAQVLYFLSLDIKNTNEESDQYLSTSISILKFYNQSNPNEVSLNKEFLDFLLLDESEQLAFTVEKIGLILNKGLGFQKTQKLLPILSNKYFDFIQKEAQISVDESLHNGIIFALSYRAGVCETEILFKTKEKLQQFEPVKEELNKCLDLGFQTFALLIIMREQLTWNQIEERSAGLTRLQKNFLYLHCLDSLDHRELFGKLIETNTHDLTKLELSVHFSILVILAKSLSERLDQELHAQISSHINSLSSTEDVFAYAFAYFLAKSVNHQSIEEILLKSESHNILFHQVNAFLESQ